MQCILKIVYLIKNKKFRGINVRIKLQSKIVQECTSKDKLHMYIKEHSSSTKTALKAALEKSFDYKTLKRIML